MPRPDPPPPTTVQLAEQRAEEARDEALKYANKNGWGAAGVAGKIAFAQVEATIAQTAVSRSSPTS